MKLMAFLAALLLSLPPVMAGDRPARPSEDDVHNAHEFAVTAEPLGDHDGFSATGRATRAARAWRQVQALVDEMAKRGDVPDGAMFRATLRWRDADFVRVLVAHLRPGPWPVVEFVVIWGSRGHGPRWPHRHCHYWPPPPHRGPPGPPREPHRYDPPRGQPQGPHYDKPQRPSRPKPHTPPRHGRPGRGGPRH